MTHFNTTDSSYNVTNLTDALLPQFELWVATLAINLSLICVCIWLAITIGAYGFKSGKFRRQRKADFSGGLILKLLFLSALTIIPRLVSTLVVALVGFETGSKNDYICEVAEDVSIGAYYVALLPAYLFLWFRQRSLYLQPSIERLYTVTIKCFSWGCLIFLITAGIGIIIIFVLPLAYQASPRGCILREEEEENVLAFYVFSIFLIVGQFTLLSLFIYPLHVHRNVKVSNPVSMTIKAEKRFSSEPSDRDFSVQTEEESEDKVSVNIRNSNDSSSFSPKRQSFAVRVGQTITNFQQNHLQQQFKTQVRKQKKNSHSTGKRIKRVMKRSIVSALVCILSDLTALGLVGFVIDEKTAKSFTNTVFDISLIVNITSLICSFDTYKKIFNAPCASSSVSKRLLATSTGGQSANNTEDSKARNSQSKDDSH